jgi:hypothetical protein
MLQIRMAGADEETATAVVALIEIRRGEGKVRRDFAGRWESAELVVGIG